MLVPELIVHSLLCLRQPFVLRSELMWHKCRGSGSLTRYLLSSPFRYFAVEVVISFVFSLFWLKNSSSIVFREELRMGSVQGSSTSFFLTPDSSISWSSLPRVAEPNKRRGSCSWCGLAFKSQRINGRGKAGPSPNKRRLLWVPSSAQLPFVLGIYYR